MALKLGGTAKAIADANKKREEEEKKAKESKNTWDGMKAAAASSKNLSDYSKWSNQGKKDEEKSGVNMTMAGPTNKALTSSQAATAAQANKATEKPKITYTGQKTKSAQDFINDWNAQKKQKNQYALEDFGRKNTQAQAYQAQKKQAEQLREVGRALDEDAKNPNRPAVRVAKTAQDVARDIASGKVKIGGKAEKKESYKPLTAEEAAARALDREQREEDVRRGLVGNTKDKNSALQTWMNDEENGADVWTLMNDMMGDQRVSAATKQAVMQANELLGVDGMKRAMLDNADSRAYMEQIFERDVWNPAQEREKAYNQKYGNPSETLQTAQERMRAHYNAQIDTDKQSLRQIAQTNPLFAAQQYSGMRDSYQQEIAELEAMRADMERHPEAYAQWEKDMARDRLLAAQNELASLGDIEKEWQPDYQVKSQAVEGVNDPVYKMINGEADAFQDTEAMAKWRMEQAESLGKREKELQEQLNALAPGDPRRELLQGQIDTLRSQTGLMYEESAMPTLDNLIFSEMMDEGDRLTYNYIYRTEGRNAANEYLDRTKTKWYAGYTDKELQELNDWLQESGWNMALGNLASMVTAPAEAISNLVYTMRTAKGELVDAKDPMFLLTRKSNLTRQATGEALANLPDKNFVGIDKGSPAEQWLNNTRRWILTNGYNLLSSGMDQYGTAWLMVVPGIGQALATGALAGKAGTAAIIETLDEGGFSRQASCRGVVTALCEYGTEKIGMERLVDAFSKGKLNAGFAKTLTKSMLSEALEEVPGNLIDRAMDNWYGGENSHRNQEIKARMKQGMSQAQAEAAVDLEFIQQTATEALMAGLSAGISQGVGYVVGNVNAKHQANREQRQTLNDAARIEREYQDKYGAETAEAVRTLAQEETTEEGRVAALTTAANAVLADKRGPINPEIAEIILKNDHPDGMKTDELNDWRQTFTNVLNDSQRVRQAEEIRKQRNQGRQQRAGERVEAEKAKAAELNEEETRTAAEETVQPEDAGTTAETPTPRTTPEERRAEAAELNEQETVRPAAEETPAQEAPTPRTTPAERRAEAERLNQEETRTAAATEETAPTPRTTPAERRAEAERLNEFETRRAELNEELKQLDRDYNDANNVRDMTRVRERQEEVRRQLQELDMQEHAYNQTRTFNGLDADSIIGASEQRTTPEERRAELERLNQEETRTAAATEKTAPTPRTTPAERRAEAEQLNEQETRQEPVTQADVMEAIQEESEEQDRRGVFAAPATVDGGETQVTGIVTTQHDEKNGAQVEVTDAEGNKKTVKLGDVRFGRAWQRGAYDIATSFRDADAARAFLAVAEQESMPLDSLRRDFARYYQYGRNQNKNMLNVAGKAISDASARAAYEAGARSLTSEGERIGVDKSVGKSVRTYVENLLKNKPWATAEDFAHYGGASLDASVNVRKLSATQTVQLYVLDQMGKKYGIHFNLGSNMPANVAGMYAGGNMVMLNIGSADSNLTRAAGHEVFHLLKDWNSTAADVLRDQLFGAMEETGWDLDARVAEKQEDYKKRANQELTREEAMEELAADSLFDLFTREEQLNELFNKADSEGKGVLAKAAEFVKRVVNELRQMMQRAARQNPEVSAVLDADQEKMNQVYSTADMILNAYATARQAETENQAETQERYSLTDIEEHDTETERLIRENNDLGEALQAANTLIDIMRKRPDGLPAAPSAASIDRLARKIKDETGTKVSLKNLRENLDKTFTVMLNAERSGDVEMAYEMLGDIAADAVNQADVIYDPATAMGYDGDEVRSWLTSLIQGIHESDWGTLSEIVGTSNANEIRKWIKDKTGVWMRSTAKLGENAETGATEWQGSRDHRERRNAHGGIDGDYETFARNFPGIVDPDVNDTEDMIAQVLDALDRLKPQVVNRYESADYNEGHPEGVETAKARLTAELFQAYLEDDSFTRAMTGAEATRLSKENRRIIQGMDALKEQLRETEQKVNKAMDKLIGAEKRQARTVEMLKNARKEQERIAQSWREKVADQAHRRAENEEYNKLKNHVVKIKNRLQRMAMDPSNTSRGFIPRELNDVVDRLLRAVDYDGTFIPEGATAPTLDAAGRAKMDADLVGQLLEAYQTARTTPENGSYILFDEDLPEVIARLRDSLKTKAEGKAAERGIKGTKDYRLTKAERLTMQEMQDLDRIVSGMEAMVRNANKAFTDAKGRRIEEIGEAALEQVDKYVETHGEKKTGTRITEWLNAGLKNGMMKPVTYFDMMRDTEFNRLFYEGDRSLRNAEGTQVRLMQGAEEKLNELLDKYHMRDSFNRSGAATQKKRREKAVEITLKTGEKLRITDQEAMSIYATYQREKDGVTNHLLTGGIMLQDRDRQTTNKPMVLFLDDINAIIDTLTDEQKAFVDEAVGYLSTDVAEWGNEITRQLYGVDKFTEKYYFPFEVVKSTVEAKVAEAQDQRIKVGSQTKALTVGANNALNIRGFTEVWCQHVEKMADYNAFVLPIEDMTRLLNYQHIIRNDDGDIIGRGRNIKTEMEAAYGKESVQYLVRFLSTLNGNAAHEHGNSWLNSFTSKAKGAAVGGNLSVVLQQAGAGVRASAEIGAKHILKGIVPGSINKQWAELQAHAWIAVEKDWGYLDTQQTGSLATRNQRTLLGRINEKAGAAAGFMDKLNWTQIWAAVKSEQAELHKDMDPKSDAFLDLCGKRFTEVIDKTQVIDSVFQRSAWAMEKGRMANFMAFMNEPIAQYNMLLRGAMRMQEAARMQKGEARTKAMREGAVMLTRNSLAITVSAMLTSALAALVRGMRDKDDKKYEEYIDENGEKKRRIAGRKTYLDKVAEQWWPGVLDSLTSLGGVYADIAKGIFTGEEISNDMSMTWVTSAGYMVRNLVKLAQGGTADPERTAYYGMQVVSNLTGVPVSNVYRDVTAMVRTLRDEFVTAGTTEGDAWDISLSMEQRLAAAQNSYVYNKAAKTGEAANRKVNTEIWTALMMAEYKRHGESAMFTKIVNAAQKAGASADAMLNKFKAEFPKINPLVDKAAQALNRGDFTTYDKTVKELETKYRLGSKTVNAMVRTAYNAMQEKTETKSTKDFSKELHADQGTSATIGETVAKDALAKALASGTEKQIRDAVAQAKKQGRTDNEIQTQVRQAYQKDFVDALVSGNKAKAQGIVKKILASGAYDEAGIAEKTLDWVKSENSSGLYESIKRGDSRQAAKVYSWMCQTYGSSTMTKSIASWLRTNASEYEDNVRTCLKAMGYGAASIDKIVKDSYASKKKTPKTNKTNKTKTTKAWE